MSVRLQQSSACRLIVLAAALTATLTACGVDDHGQEPTSSPTEIIQTDPTATRVGSSTPAPTLAPTPVEIGSSTPVPPPYPTPAPTATPGSREFIVIWADFGEPAEEAAVFEALLARLPDNEHTRVYAQLFDQTGTMELLGLEPPAPDASPEDVEEFFSGLPLVRPANVEAGKTFRFTNWPAVMGQHSPLFDWYPYVAFSPWSVDYHATTNNPFGAERTTTYDVAIGDFNPQATSDALANCGCDQPDLNDYDGYTYYSWREEFEQDLRDRLAPPLYDYVGRGPRVMVTEGEAIWSLANAAVENYIDVRNDVQLSLADDPDYLAAARWLASMGTPIDMTFAAREMGVLDDPSGVLNSPQFQEMFGHAPLLKKFSMAASATVYDGERTLSGLVVVHDDPETAEANAELLRERIEILVGDSVELVEIEANGRFLLARAQVSRGNLFSLVINTLVIHE